jgi:hypothetical protein
MSISPAMNKAFRHIALLILLMGMGSYAQAQFVAIRLELPAGVSFNAQVLDPMAGGTWEINKAKVWIKIETSENLTLLIEIGFPEGEIIPPLEAYFLNDGSSDFEQGTLLQSGVQELRVMNSEKLIQNMTPRPAHLQAWLGLPMVKGLTLKIEYP